MTEPPRIVFPCSYPIKVMGENLEAMQRDVLAVFAECAELDPEVSITTRESAGGRFIGLTVTIIATGEPQLALLNDRLRAVPGVRLVL